MRFWSSFLAASLFILSFSLFNCSSESKSSIAAEDETFGAIQLRIALNGNTPFKSLVRSGTVTVSATDMTTLVSDLILEDSSVSARIIGVPTGKARLVEIKAFDSAGTVRYQGSGLVDVAADSTSQAVIDLIRLTGTLVVNGKVVENDSNPPASSTAWPDPVTVTLGAQASATYGAFLDLDTRSAWTSVQANANQEKIDLVCLFYNGNLHLEDAVAARAAGVNHSINLTSLLDSTRIQAVARVKLAVMPSSQEAAKSAFETGPLMEGSTLVVGDRFMVKTTDGHFVLARVMALNGLTSSGTVTLELYGLTIP